METQLPKLQMANAPLASHATAPSVHVPLVARYSPALKFVFMHCAFSRPVRVEQSVEEAESTDEDEDGVALEFLSIFEALGDNMDDVVSVKRVLSPGTVTEVAAAEKED